MHMQRVLQKFSTCKRQAWAIRTGQQAWRNNQHDNCSQTTTQTGLEHSWQCNRMPRMPSQKGETKYGYS